MKLTFMIYLVATAVVVTCLGEWSAHLLEAGDKSGSNFFFWLTLLTLCVGALLTLRRAFIDEVIKN